MCFSISELDFCFWLALRFIFASSFTNFDLSFLLTWRTHKSHTKSENSCWNPFYMADSISTPTCFSFLTSLLASSSSRAHLVNSFSSSLKWSMIGPKNTRCFSASELMSCLLRYVVSVTPKRRSCQWPKLQLLVQQKWTMTFICLSWYKNAKNAGLLTDNVSKMSQFCC